MLKAAPLLSLLGSCRQEGGACPVLTHLGPLLASATVLASGVVGQLALPNLLSLVALASVLDCFPVSLLP